MAEALFGLADLGGTQQRVAVWDETMRVVGESDGLIDPGDYEGTVNDVADDMHCIVRRYHVGELVSVSVAVAGELDDNGRLVRAGSLTPWVGRCVGADMAAALSLPDERVGSLNDMQAVGLSQAAVNEYHGRRTDGVATTLSSGWGGARYLADGTVVPDEPGHQFLREAGQCPCGGANHAEAFISGNGIQLNWGMHMRDWLARPQGADSFVKDLSTAVIQMLERHRGDGFEPSEIRWMGGVAMNQPLLMRRAEELTRDRIGDRSPGWETVTLRHQAGIHGTFIHARQLAAAA